MQLALKEVNYTVAGKKIEVVKGSSDASPESARQGRPQAGRAGRRAGPDRAAVRLGGHRGQGLRQDAAQGDLPQRLLGRAGHDPDSARPRTSSASRPTACNGWPASATTSTTRRASRRSPSWRRIIPSRTARWKASCCPSARLGGHVPVQGLGADRQQGLLVGHRRAFPDDVDAILVVLGGADAINFLTQYQQAGGTLPLIGGSITADQTVLGTKGQQRKAVLGMPSAGPDGRRLGRPEVEGLHGRIQEGLPGRLPLSVAVRRRLLREHQGGAPGAAAGQRRPFGRRRQIPRGSVEADLRHPDRPGQARPEPQRHRGHLRHRSGRGTRTAALFNKVVSIAKDVDETLGEPEAEFLKLGPASRDNPDCK